LAKGFTDKSGKFRPTDGSGSPRAKSGEEFGIPRRRSSKRKSIQVGVGRKQEIQMMRIQKRFPNDKPQPDSIGNISSTERMLAEVEVDSTIDEVGFDDNLYEFENGQEWWIFTDSNEARDRAVEQEKDLLDTEEEIASDLAKRFPNEEFIFITDTDKRIISAEQGDFAVEDRDLEELKQMAGNFNVIVPPNLQTPMGSIQDDEEVDEKILDRFREDIASAIADDIEGRLDDPVRYFIDDEGLYSAEDLLKQNFIRTDIDKMAEFVVDTDGVANTLSGYDGNEIVVRDKDNKERLYMYRSN